eukprot:jgi/Mesvir1/26233/Mv02409-RA.1
MAAPDGDDKARALFSACKYADAAEEYARLTQAQPCCAKWLTNQAKCLIHLDRHADAIPLCVRSIAVDKGWARGYEVAGQSMLVLHQFREAIELLMQGMSAAPSPLIEKLLKDARKAGRSTQSSASNPQYTQARGSNPSGMQARGSSPSGMQARGSIPGSHLLPPVDFHRPPSGLGRFHPAGLPLGLLGLDGTGWPWDDPQLQSDGAEKVVTVTVDVPLPEAWAWRTVGRGQRLREQVQKSKREGCVPEMVSVLETGAIQGCSMFMSCLVSVYMDPDTSAFNPYMGLEWARRCISAGPHPNWVILGQSDPGVAACQGMLGCAYFRGTGVGKDLGEAERWLRLAVEAGDPPSVHNLGLLLEEVGRLTEAVAMHTRGAERGEPVSMLRLGQLLAAGTGCARDVAAAAAWFDKGAAAGDLDAVWALVELAITQPGAERSPILRTAREHLRALNADQPPLWAVPKRHLSPGLTLAMETSVCLEIQKAGDEAMSLEDMRAVLVAAGDAPPSLEEFSRHGNAPGGNGEERYQQNLLDRLSRRRPLTDVEWEAVELAQQAATQASLAQANAGSPIPDHVFGILTSLGRLFRAKGMDQEAHMRFALPAAEMGDPEACHLAGRHLAAVGSSGKDRRAAQRLLSQAAAREVPGAQEDLDTLTRRLARLGGDAGGDGGDSTDSGGGGGGVGVGDVGISQEDAADGTGVDDDAALKGVHDGCGSNDAASKGAYGLRAVGAAAPGVGSEAQDGPARRTEEGDDGMRKKKEGGDKVEEGEDHGRGEGEGEGKGQGMETGKGNGNETGKGKDKCKAKGKGEAKGKQPAGAEGGYGDASAFPVGDELDPEWIPFELRPTESPLFITGGPRVYIPILEAYVRTHPLSYTGWSLLYSCRHLNRALRALARNDLAATLADYCHAILFNNKVPTICNQLDLYTMESFPSPPFQRLLDYVDLQLHNGPSPTPASGPAPPLFACNNGTPSSSTRRTNTGSHPAPSPSHSGASSAHSASHDPRRAGDKDPSVRERVTSTSSEAPPTLPFFQAAIVALHLGRVNRNYLMTCVNEALTVAPPRLLPAMLRWRGKAVGSLKDFGAAMADAEEAAALLRADASTSLWPYDPPELVHSHGDDSRSPCGAAQTVRQVAQGELPQSVDQGWRCQGVDEGDLAQGVAQGGSRVAGSPLSSSPKDLLPQDVISRLRGIMACVLESDMASAALGLQRPEGVVAHCRRFQQGVPEDTHGVCDTYVDAYQASEFVPPRKGIPATASPEGLQALREYHRLLKLRVPVYRPLGPNELPTLHNGPIPLLLSMKRRTAARPAAAAANGTRASDRRVGRGSGSAGGEARSASHMGGGGPAMKMCWGCEQRVASLLRCGQCRLAGYCSRECQKKHWKEGHREACAKLA